MKLIDFFPIFIRIQNKEVVIKKITTSFRYQNSNALLSLFYFQNYYTVKIVLAKHIVCSTHSNFFKLAFFYAFCN